MAEQGRMGPERGTNFHPAVSKLQTRLFQMVVSFPSGERQQPDAPLVASGARVQYCRLTKAEWFCPLRPSTPPSPPTRPFREVGEEEGCRGYVAMLTSFSGGDGSPGLDSDLPRVI